MTWFVSIPLAGGKVFEWVLLTIDREGTCLIRCLADTGDRNCDQRIRPKRVSRQLGSGSRTETADCSRLADLAEAASCYLERVTAQFLGPWTSNSFFYLVNGRNTI